MIKSIRMVLVLLLLLASTMCMLAQKREPQNIYRVRVNSRYIIEDGQRTSKYFAIKQEMSDSLGRLHTEIEYQWETRYPHIYRWHYFNGMRKYKTEHFYMDKMVRREEFTLDDNDRIKEMVVWNVSPVDTVFAFRVEYAYNPDGTISQSAGYNDKGKRGFRATYKYNSQGTEISRKVKGKKLAPPDSTLQLTRVPQYNDQGQLTSETVTVQKIGNKPSTSVKEYTYTPKGDLATEIIKTASGSTIERRAYYYRHDNRLQRLERFDADDNLVEFLAWRYEIYKTADRRARVLE